MSQTLTAVMYLFIILFIALWVIEIGFGLARKKI